MCGIAGILSSSSRVDGATLERTLRRFCVDLHHRGPDESAIERAGPSGVAHTRLAILDLTETGAQPMWSPTRSHLLVYNGEVYNFEALRRELELAGERFAGTSDTEVVLRMLATQGIQALERFDGMFALALLDERGQTALLARDRAGQKPLYVARRSHGGWAFASELTPLLAVPDVDATLSPEGLSHILTFGFAPAPHTMRRDIFQLQPGAWVRLRVGHEPELGRFAPEPAPARPESDPRDLEATLEQAVAEHLVSDVPVGVLLSGGIDSSTVAALAARRVGRLKTFTVVYDDPAYDERDAARAVADHIGSDHNEVEISRAPLSQQEFDCLVDHHGDPFGDTSSLNVLRLSRELAKHVKVALSGDGGDEVFAGYRRYAILPPLAALSRIPGGVLGLASALLQRAAGERGRQSARFLDTARMSAVRRQVAYTSLFWPEEQVRLIDPAWLPEEPSRTFDRLMEERGATLAANPAEAAHWQEQRLMLPDNMLTKVDRMSAAASVELRAPLLSGRVLDLAARLPFREKQQHFVGKRALRRVARRLVPPWVVDRPKQGFAIPIEDIGGQVFVDAFRFAVSSNDSPLRRIFRPGALDAIGRSLDPSSPARDPEDSLYRRVHRRWMLALLARTLDRQGIGG